MHRLPPATVPPTRPGRRWLAGLAALGLAATGVVGISTAPASSAATVAGGDYAGLVNPFVGTEDEGNAYPGAVVPFGMVQLSPDNTNTYSSTSYSNRAGRVWGFSHRHVNSAGCPAAGELLVTPSTTDTPITTREFIGLKNPAETERAHAGYYTAELDNDVEVELTATERTGVHRYTFPEGAAGNISLNVGQSLNSTGASSVTWVDDHTLEGYVTTSGFCWGTPDTSYYFSASFDRDAEATGTWDTSGTYTEGSASSDVDSGDNGAVATFDTSSDQTVELTVGVSFVDLDGARANREAEGFDAGERLAFDEVAQRAADSWNAALGRFDVTMSDEEQLTIFYTQLYKSLLSPIIGSDVDGRYRGLDADVHQTDGWTYYQRFSLWDTYRTQATLHALFEHDRATDIVRSMNRARIEGGWLPRWSLDMVETGVMAGDPVSPWVAENFALDTVPAEISDELWGYLVENATTAPPEDVLPPGRQSAEFYLEHGHIPFYFENEPGLGQEYEEYRHGGSATMEFAHSDAAIGAAGMRTDRPADAMAFLERGTNWSTLWNPDVELTGGFTGIVNAVTPEGEFVSAPELAPVQDSGFHEGTPWHYQWMVPQDVTGLTRTMGGEEAFAERLDYYVDLPALRENPGASPSTWARGGSDYYTSIGYNPGNEPMLGTPWLYGFIGQPAKTNDVLTAQLNRFPNTPGGGVGNDDLGTMSSWYVLATLGVYPVQPGSGIMALNAPRVEAATVTLDNGATIEIDAPGASSSEPRYITGLTVDGEEHTAAWLDVSELQDGARLAFELSESPEGLTWATDEHDRIPSVSDPLIAELGLSDLTDGPISAVEGEEVTASLARAELDVVSGPAPAADQSVLEARIDWGEGLTSPATITAEEDGWEISTAVTFEAAGTYEGELTVTSALATPAFAPEPFAAETLPVTAVVEAADDADSAGAADDGADDGADEANGADDSANGADSAAGSDPAADSEADSAAGSATDGSDGSGTNDPGAEPLPDTGAPMGAAILAVLALLGAGIGARAWTLRRAHAVR